jgi:hypothetical protein
MSTDQLGRAMRQAQGGMTSGLSFAIFFILLLISLAVAFGVSFVSPPLGVAVLVPELILSLLIAASIKVANQWERGLVLRLGRFGGTRGPGLFFLIPVFERVRIVDLRVQTHDIRHIDGLGPTASNTVVLAVPIEILDLARKMGAG